MAGRNPKNNADYFPHENGMRNDKKIKAVRARFGLDGYAIYNMLLESLAEADLICIEWSEIEIEMFSGDFGVESGKLKEMVSYFCSVNLFKIANGYLFCTQLDKRLGPVFSKRKSSLDNLRSLNSISASEIQISEKEIELPSRGSKEKKRKEKENIENEILIGEFLNVKISEKEIEKLKSNFGEEKTKEKIEKLSMYLASTGKKYKSHYATILNWSRREEPGINKKSCIFCDYKKRKVCEKDTVCGSWMPAA